MDRGVSQSQNLQVPYRLRHELSHPARTPFQFRIQETTQKNEKLLLTWFHPRKGSSWYHQSPHSWFQHDIPLYNPSRTQLNRSLISHPAQEDHLPDWRALHGCKQPLCHSCPGGRNHLKLVFEFHEKWGSHLHVESGVADWQLALLIEIARKRLQDQKFQRQFDLILSISHRTQPVQPNLPKWKIPSLDGC